MGHHKGTSVYGKSFTSPMKSLGPKVNRNYLDDVNNIQKVETHGIKVFGESFVSRSQSES